MVNLWVDDLRDPPEPGFNWLWAKTSEEALGLLELSRSTNNMFERVSLDHDLSVDENGTDDTTRRIAIWMIQENVWPKSINIHSMNPVGREWLVGTFNRYAPSHVILEWNV